MATASLHSLLLLADSALPLGSFAFSSGLESFLGHNKHPTAAAKLQAFDLFLDRSLRNISSTALPYVLTAFRSPDQLQHLDNDFDASTPCTVARRASIAQGRAMLTIWERALEPSANLDSANPVTAFAAAVKTSKPDTFGLQLNAHFPPLFGAVCSALALSEDDTAYIFLLNHAKALLSAAVRASVIGPYQSQAILSDAKLRGCIKNCILTERDRNVHDAVVTVPTMDLWMGRHELLYSRIFNS